MASPEAPKLSLGQRKKMPHHQVLILLSFVHRMEQRQLVIRPEEASLQRVWSEVPFPIILAHELSLE